MACGCRLPLPQREIGLGNLEENVSRRILEVSFAIAPHYELLHGAVESENLHLHGILIQGAGQALHPSPWEVAEGTNFQMTSVTCQMAGQFVRSLDGRGRSCIVRLGAVDPLQAQGREFVNRLEVQNQVPVAEVF